MTELTRRGVIGAAAAFGASAALERSAALGAEPLLASVLCDGPDGVLSAGVIARRGDGTVALSATAGRRMTGAGAGYVEAPFGLDDPFRVASVSKMIATTGFMRLVEAGRIRLEDDASTHLGFRLRHPAHPDTAITIQMLLSHTSALRNGPSYPVPAGHSLREAFEPDGRNYDGGAWFAPPDKPPGQWFAYADVNFCLIGQIIERLTAERFDHYMTRHVLTPAGLDAGYNWSGVSQGKRDRAASARRWLDGRWTAQVDEQVPPAPAVVYPQPRDMAPLSERELKTGENGFLFSPLGGLRLSLKDMDRLAALLRNGGTIGGHRIVRRASLAKMRQPVWVYDPASPNGETDGGVFGGYGLGVECPQGRPGADGDAFFGETSRDWRGHLGDAYGWMTGLFWNVRDGRTLVYALNGMREDHRPAGLHSALTRPEEQVVDMALRAFGR